MSDIKYPDNTPDSAVGQKTAANSTSVTIASDQTVSVSGSVTASGTVTANQGTAGANAWKVDGSGVTQPVSGTVTANAGTGPWPVTDNGGSLTVDGTVTANAGTGPWPVTDNSGSLTVDATALPLPTGAASEAKLQEVNVALGTAVNSLALIKAKTDNIDVALSTRTKPADTQIVSGAVTTTPTNVVSTLNSTTTPLGANGSFTGTWEDVTNYITVGVSCYSDVASTSEGLFFDWSSDGITTLMSHDAPLIANQGLHKHSDRRAKYFRVRYFNGTTAQSDFSLQTIYSTTAANEHNNRVQIPPALNDQAVLTQAVLFGQSEVSTSVFTAVKTTVNGLLEVNSEPSELRISRTGILSGYDAAVEYLVGRRDGGYSSTSVLQDIAQYLDTSQPRINAVDTGTTYYIRSSSTNDDGDPAGTGARTVRIVYLDANGYEQVTTATLNGTTAVSLGSGFSYFQWMEVASVGSNAAAVGNITISSVTGAPTVAQIVAYIKAEGNRSMDGRYKVPTGTTAYITKWQAGCVGSANQDLRIRATVFADDRTLSTVHHFQDNMLLANSTRATSDLTYRKCPAGTEIKVSTLSSNTAAANIVDCSAEILLITDAISSDIAGEGANMSVTGGVPTVNNVDLDINITDVGADFSVEGGVPTVENVAAPAIAYVDAGALTSENTAAPTFSVAPPAGIQNNDILILITDQLDAATSTTPSGWTSVDNASVLSCFYKRTSGSESNVSVNVTNYDGENPYTVTGRMYAFRGCITSGSPIDVQGSVSSSTGSTTVTGSGLTTATNNATICLAISKGGANVSWSTPGVTIDTIVTAGSATGSIGLGYMAAGNGAAGAKSAPTCEQSSSAQRYYFTFALKPA